MLRKFLGIGLPIALLLKLVTETEKEAVGKNCGVAPWYYCDARTN
jgi:hypothetical protein